MGEKLLIATTNQGKYKEIVIFLADLPFELIGLNDLEQKIKESEETENTFEGNSLLKAKYYAENTGLLTLSEDTGICINKLSGWPGVKSAREFANYNSEWEAILHKMQGIKVSERSAYVQCTATVYDPGSAVYFSGTGRTDGEILVEPGENRHNFGFDPVFYVPELGKVYGEMTVQEKNSVSHRGKALLRVKHYLQSYYAKQHLVVPCAIIVHNGEMLTALRNDPHRPDFHRKWELPGGRMEYGEEIGENLVREVEEETGYVVEIVKRLNHIEVDRSENYQVYLLPHVCKIIGGKESPSDAEILKIDWVEPEKIFERDLIGNDPQMLRAVMPELIEIITQHKL